MRSDSVMSNEESRDHETALLLIESTTCEPLEKGIGLDFQRASERQRERERQTDTQIDRRTDRQRARDGIKKVVKECGSLWKTVEECGEPLREASSMTTQAG